MAPRSRSRSAAGAPKAKQAQGTATSAGGFTVGVFLVLYVLLSTAVPIYLHTREHGRANAVQGLLAFFLGLNSLICIWEMALGLHISHIKKEYLALQSKYGDDRLGAVMAFFYTPLSPSLLFSTKFWSKVWSTYSLYDPSYSNRESFGFFVDVSNGWTTILPSLLYLYAMTYSVAGVSARLLGCVGLVKFYVEFHGTCVYFLSFFFNQRHHNKSPLEVALFVGVSNGLWFIFPLLGVWASTNLIFSNSFAIFR